MILIDMNPKYLQKVQKVSTVRHAIQRRLSNAVEVDDINKWSDLLLPPCQMHLVCHLVASLPFYGM
jgi:hypothetical protein